MPDQDQTPNQHDDLTLDGLDLEGVVPDDNLDGLEDALAGLDDLSGDELTDPDEPPAPEDADESLETEDDLDPDEHRVEASTSVNQRFGSRNRNPERRKTELDMFQDFMTTSIPELRAYSSGLQSEAERIQEIKAQREREERRQARIASRSQVETFLEKTEGAGGYEAPTSDLTDNTSLLALKETFAPIAGLSLDDFTYAPSTIEEKNAAFPASRFPRMWVSQIEISPWLRASRGIAGLLPEWHDLEKHDIKTGKPVFKRIGIALIPDEQELPAEAEGFIRRDIGPGVIPIGWHKKMQTSGATYFIGETSSIVILNNSSLSTTTSLSLPTGTALTNRANRIAIAVEGGLKALRKQAHAKAPMAGRDGIESIVQGKINLLSTSERASQTVYTNAVGASAWDSTTQREGQNQSVSTATFNNTNEEQIAALALPAADIRQIASLTVSNQNGQTTRSRDNEITLAVSAMTAVHAERSRASSRSNLLKGASCVRSNMVVGADGTVLTLATDIGKETLTATFRVGANGITSLSEIALSSADMEPIRIIPAINQDGNPLNSAPSLITMGTAILDKMEQLRDFFEEGIGNRRDIISGTETLRSLILNHSGEITGVPYTPEDLASSASTLRAEIDAEIQEHRRAATVDVFDAPPENDGNIPQFRM